MGNELRFSPISSSDSKVLTRAGYGGIYFLGVEGDETPAPLKVGCARDVQARLSSHQTSNWRSVIAQEVLFFKCRASLVQERRVKDAVRTRDDDAYDSLIDEITSEELSVEAIEGAIHNDLDHQGLRLRGEWFGGGPELVVGSAKRVLRDMGLEFDTSRSMARRLKMWKIEAEETGGAFGKAKSSNIRTLADYAYARVKRYGATKAPI